VCRRAHSVIEQEPLNRRQWDRLADSHVAKKQRNGMERNTARSVAGERVSGAAMAGRDTQLYIAVRTSLLATARTTERVRSGATAGSPLLRGSTRFPAMPRVAMAADGWRTAAAFISGCAGGGYGRRGV
jgi:hypothetical protein